MGGTAIGTGLNAPPGFAERCTAQLSKITGMPIRLALNLVEALAFIEELHNSGHECAFKSPACRSPFASCRTSVYFNSSGE